MPSWQVNFETLGLRYFYVLEGKKGLEGELSTKGRSNVLIGYLIMGITFLILRFFYHVLPKKDSQDSLIQTEKNDFLNLYVYAKQIILSHPQRVKTIIVSIVALIVIPRIPYKVEILYVFYDAISTIMYVLLVTVFVPQEDASRKGFPVEIFGFSYSVIFMFYSAGSLVIDIFYYNNFFKEDIWIYGYSTTIISYVICIATLRRFMERDLSKEEIVLLGMIMLTTLEFITYYGIGFFSSINKYNPADYETNIFGNITSVINQGIYVASQSQILERSPMEVWGNIILNGTDVLTITAVLGYLVQKFMVNGK